MKIKNIRRTLMKNWKLIFAVFLLGCVSLFALDNLISTSKDSSYFTSRPIPINSKNPKKTLVFSYGGNDHREFFRTNIELFQKEHPDIEVKLQQLPTATDYQRSIYKTSLAANESTVDVFYADMVWTAEFASSGNILPLDYYFTEDMQKDFLPNSVQACYYDSRVYAVPSRIDAPLLYYRSDIISIPPRTWDEMLQLISENKDNPYINYSYIFQGYTYEGLVCNALEFIWNNGGMVTDSSGNIKINSLQARKALQVFVDIANSNKTKDCFNFQEDDSWMAFQDGSALFMRNWPYVFEQLSGATSKMRGKFGIAPLPIGPDGSKSTGTLGGWNFMINKNTKDPSAAWEFVQWMSNYESQLRDSILAGSIPTRKAIYDDPNFIAELPWISDYKEIFENAQIRPASPNYSLISDSLQSNFKAALTKRITVDEALCNIESDLQRINNTNRE